MEEETYQQEPEYYEEDLNYEEEYEEQNNNISFDSKHESQGWFSSLTRALKNPSAVEYLDISGQNRKKIGASIGLFENLLELNCSDNQLTTLPSELGSLTNLEYLDCSGNKFTKLPKGIKDWENKAIIPNILIEFKSTIRRLSFEGKHDEALDMGDEILDILEDVYKEFPVPKLEIEILIAMAEVYQRKGDYKNAEDIIVILFTM